MWNPHKSIVIASTFGTVIGLSFITKSYIGGPKYENTIRIDDKVVIITGANTGIGKETTRELAKRGGKIIMACRDMDKCEQARREIVLESKNKYVYCRLCDLSSIKSIHEFVERFNKEHNRLDILINNAGVMRCPKLQTAEGFEMQLGVNHLGHFLLTNLLLDKLKKSSPSRVINVSSRAHVSGKIDTEDLNSDKSYDPGQAYSQSKLANILFTRELAKRLEGTGVTVNAVHPGVVDTELIRHIDMIKNPLVAVFYKPISWLFFKTPIQGAQTTLYVALDPSLEKVTGKYFSDVAEKEVAPQAKDDIISKWLWLVSEKWTRLS